MVRHRLMCMVWQDFALMWCLGGGGQSLLPSWLVKRLASASMVSSSSASILACRLAAIRSRRAAACFSCSAALCPARHQRSASARVMAVAGGRSVAGELGDCFLCAGVVDEVLAGGRGGDERGGSGVVQGAGQAGGDAVQPGDGVVGEQGLLAPGEGKVVAQVGG